LWREVDAQVAVGETAGQQTEHAECGEQCLDAGIGEAHPRDTLSGRGGDWVGDRGQCFDAVGGVVAESLDVQQASVGGKADLPQGGQIGQPFADGEVVGVVDGGFGP